MFARTWTGTVSEGNSRGPCFPPGKRLLQPSEACNDAAFHVPISAALSVSVNSCAGSGRLK